MPPENSDRPPLPSASTEWALTAILREARNLSPSKIPGEAIHRETTQNHSGGSLLFASRVMRIIRVAAGREATYRRQQPKLDPQHQEKKQYHCDAHAALMPALTELAYQVVDGVNAHGKGYSGKFFVEPARPVPDNAGDEYHSVLAIKTHPKEAQALITQGVGSFLFHSKYHGDPEKRSASIEFQPQKTELDIKPGDGFYPPPKSEILKRGSGEADEIDMDKRR